MSTELNANPDTIGGKKDVLVKDIKTVVGDADVLLREIAGAAADGYTTTRAKLGDRLGETRTRIANRTRSLADSGQAYARDNPWKVAGATAVAGLVLGYLLRRR